jgi:hypothetical protein
MTILEQLCHVAEAPLLLVAADAAALAAAVDRWGAAGLTACIARGRKMRTVTGLFDEVAAAMQFPPYFGENWAAFDECLADLSLPPRPQLKGLVLVILEAQEVLADEDAAEFATFIHTLVGAHESYSRPVSLGEAWDRPPIPFHVVFGCPAGSIDGLRMRMITVSGPDRAEVTDLEAA